MNKRPNHPPESKGRSRRRRRPNNPALPNKTEPEFVRKSPTVLKRYGVLFYETHILAKEAVAEIAAVSAQFDQLNIVIKTEGSMDDPELTAHGRVYAGEAWSLIHKRRADDGWYNEAHE